MIPKKFARLLQRQERQVERVLPKLAKSEDTTSLVKKEMREYLQRYFIGKAQNIIEQRQQDIIEKDPNETNGYDKFHAAYDTLTLLYGLGLVQKAITVVQQPPEERPTIFVTGELFLRKSAKIVEFNGSEEGALITGVNMGNVKVLTDFVALNKQATAVSIEALPEMVGQSLQKMEQLGMPLLGVFHSHPGGGPQGPSRTDLDTHEALEKICPLIGAVFTNDGHVTFYAKDLDFKVQIQGRNIEQLRDNVWKLL